MEAKVSEILENVLSLLVMEGSFEVNEGPDEVSVLIETEDAGRLIGVRGETIDALQLLVNQMVSRQVEESEFKRVIVDVGGWRKNKEGELENKARRWAEEVKENGQELELEPMPAWQRRIVHLIIEEVEGVTTESVGEGRDRHLVIRSGNSPIRKDEDEAVAEPVVEEVETPEVETEPVENVDTKAEEPSSDDK